MNCLLVFDHLNDVVYTKYNNHFIEHINKFAVLQGFAINPSESHRIDDNVIVQVFSPIITSQRIMSCQFGNSYTSIQCEDNLNLCFDEYMGYLFLSVSNESVFAIKKFLTICVTIVRYLCGPDVYQLKVNENTSQTVTNLIDNWLYLQENDQTVFVEAIEQLMVNFELNSVAIQALRKSVDKLTSLVDCPKMHAIILVHNKLLALYSSQNAKELSPNDILFSIILSSSKAKADIESFQVLLAGPGQQPTCLPHVIHRIPISEGINLVYLIEVGNAVVSSHLYETFCWLHAMQTVQIQRDCDTLRPVFEHLDAAIKKLNDSLKKVKNSLSESCTKQLIQKWDVIRKKYLEFIKNGSEEALLRAETLALGFLENLKQLLNLTAIDKAIFSSSQRQALEVGRNVCVDLNNYNDFFKVKAMRNFTLGSYLEEFPGLVHFIYVDRNSHRLTTPTLNCTADETNNLTKRKIWQMISFSRNHLQEGNLSLMWKDTTFNYAYFVWFEDSVGTSLRPVVYPTNSSKALPLPGLLTGDFYQKLKEVCFPKMQPSKMRCYELFCVHLGLVTASCVLEHTRRLAATIWDLKGFRHNPVDLL